MKTTIFTLLILLATVAQAQNNEKIKRMPNGQLKIESVDPLGAQVIALYDKNLVKLYHERTADDVTTFARYQKGKLVEFGTLQRTPAYSDNR